MRFLWLILSLLLEPPLVVDAFRSATPVVTRRRSPTIVSRQPSHNDQPKPMLNAQSTSSSSSSETPSTLEETNNDNMESEKNHDEDPRKALEQFGSLFSQVQAILTQGNSWDSDTLQAKTEEFVRTYVRVFVPGMGYAVTSWAVYLGTFGLLSISLSLSGRGYNDVLSAASAIQPLEDFLASNIDPTWGNMGISLVGLEVLSPLILGLTLALTPQTIRSLRSNLDNAGWGEDNINDRVAELLGKEQQPDQP